MLWCRRFRLFLTPPNNDSHWPSSLCFHVWRRYAMRSTMLMWWWGFSDCWSFNGSVFDEAFDEFACLRPAVRIADFCAAIVVFALSVDSSTWLPAATPSNTRFQTPSMVLWAVETPPAKVCDVIDLLPKNARRIWGSSMPFFNIGSTTTDSSACQSRQQLTPLRNAFCIVPSTCSIFDWTNVGCPSLFAAADALSRS